MEFKILENLQAMQEKTKVSKTKTVEFVLLQFENELNELCAFLSITNLEALFLYSIIISNTEQRSCDIDDIEFHLEISKLEIFKVLEIFKNLESKNLIEIYEIDNEHIPKNRFNFSDYSFEILNKKFRITKKLEHLILNQTL